MTWVYIAIVCDLIALLCWIKWYKIKAHFKRKPKVTPGKDFDAKLTVFYNAVVGQQAQKQQPKITYYNVKFDDALPYLSVAELIKIRDGILTKEERQDLMINAINRNHRYR